MDLSVIATVGNQQPYWVCTVYLVMLAVSIINMVSDMDNLHSTV